MTFAPAGVVLVVIPGPSVLFIVGRALAHGRRAALTSVAGNTTGAALVVVVVALGFGAVAARSVEVFAVIAAGLDSLWGLAAGTARDWFATSPVRLRGLGGTGGTGGPTMIATGSGSR